MSNRTLLILGIAAAVLFVLYALPSSPVVSSNRNAFIALEGTQVTPATKLDVVGGVGVIPGFSGLLGVRR